MKFFVYLLRAIGVCVLSPLLPHVPQACLAFFTVLLGSFSEFQLVPVQYLFKGLSCLLAIGAALYALVTLLDCMVYVVELLIGAPIDTKATDKPDT